MASHSWTRSFWQSSAVATALRYGSDQLTKVQQYAALQQSGGFLPRCVCQLPDNRFFFGGGAVNHVPCWLHWLGLVEGKLDGSTQKFTEVLLILFNSTNVEDDEGDDMTTGLFSEFPAIKVTILPVQKSRFPALGLGNLADLCSSVQDWLYRPNTAGAKRLVYLGGARNTSRALFIYIGFQLWRENRIDDHPARDALMLDGSPPAFRGEKESSHANVLGGLLEELRACDESSSHRVSTIHQTLHPSTSSVHPSQLFPSQLRMLEHWARVLERLRSDFTPGAVEVRHVRLVGVAVDVMGLNGESNFSERQASSAQPLIEIFLSSSALWSSRPAHSIAWANLNGSDVAPLKLVPGPFHRTPCQTSWTTIIQNAPKMGGDFMIRVLPPTSQDSFDSIFGLRRKSMELPQWMLRTQFHSSAFNDVVALNRAFELALTGTQIDGAELIIRSIATQQNPPTRPALNLFWLTPNRYDAATKASSANSEATTGSATGNGGVTGMGGDGGVARNGASIKNGAAITNGAAKTNGAAIRNGAAITNGAAIRNGAANASHRHSESRAETEDGSVSIRLTLSFDLGKDFKSCHTLELIRRQLQHLP